MWKMWKNVANSAATYLQYVARNPRHINMWRAAPATYFKGGATPRHIFQICGEKAPPHKYVASGARHIFQMWRDPPPHISNMWRETPAT